MTNLTPEEAEAMARAHSPVWWAQNDHARQNPRLVEYADEMAAPHLAAIRRAYAASPAGKVEGELKAAMVEATVLAVALAETYGNPDWRLLPDLAGIITQISNMVAGIRSERDALAAKMAQAVEALELLMRARETVGAGASIFQLTTSQVKQIRTTVARIGEKP